MRKTGLIEQLRDGIALGVCLAIPAIILSCGSRGSNPDPPATTSFPIDWDCSGKPVLRRDVNGRTLDFVAIGDPSVLYNDDTQEYWMYYTCGGVLPEAPDEEVIPRICLATSSDAETWQKHPSNPIFEPSPSGWDSLKVETVDVIKADGQFYMFYMGYNLDTGDPNDVPLYLADQPNGNMTDTYGSLGVATSPDGINWTRRSPTPIFPLSNCLPDQGDVYFDCFAMEGPTVLKEGNLWRMWYGALGANNDGETVFGIGYAESSDGIGWTRIATEPVLQGSAGAWDAVHVMDPEVIKFTDGKYYLLYSGASAQLDAALSGELTRFRDMQMGLAVSNDGGTTWQRIADSSPFIPNGAAPWAAFFLSFPTFIELETSYKIFFHGVDQNSESYEYWTIGSCTAQKN